jgi:hypothetical protein
MRQIPVELPSKIAADAAVISTAALRFAAFLVLGVAFLTALCATVHRHRVSDQSASALLATTSVH